MDTTTRPEPARPTARPEPTWTRITDGEWVSDDGRFCAIALAEGAAVTGWLVSGPCVADPIVARDLAAAQAVAAELAHRLDTGPVVAVPGGTLTLVGHAPTRHLWHFDGTVRFRSLTPTGVRVVAHYDPTGSPYATALEMEVDATLSDAARADLWRHVRIAVEAWLTASTDPGDRPGPDRRWTPAGPFDIPNPALSDDIVADALGELSALAGFVAEDLGVAVPSAPEAPGGDLDWLLHSKTLLELSATVTGTAKLALRYAWRLARDCYLWPNVISTSPTRRAETLMSLTDDAQDLAAEL